MMTTTAYNPSYGPSGQPYSVASRFADGEAISHHWTERDAMDARDAALDTGAWHVTVRGLPTRVISAGFPVVDGPLAAIED